ncbi:winged helix DNA-binding domain-containing protein [Nocardioides aurantiacus]|uniref:Winged helix DNA-binding protein n=1 Tax=Nocardioides aurantiacus TaxID=86796 RepID=A0A3N2CNW9_9ACTN|nr:winged helix DNA-binding domain-containing protein [Nocardioides aurantiacus]ROR89211.1 winged helix DNA-binding protein [Nocardioides aurantiacus]
MPLTWEDLAGRALARQFPAVEGREAAAVADTLARVGPVQSQTARSPFLGLAARLPGVEHGAIAAAYDAHLVVRGSNLRGTVHTSTAADHALLEVATRTGQRPLWARTLRLEATSLEQVWAALEDHAREEWRTPAELGEHLRAWIARHDPGATPRLEDTLGRYLAFGHGGLVRRPLTGGWEGQGKPVYRTATALLGPRDDALGDPGTTLAELVRRHLARHGPASRQDLAWWAGVGLRGVDACLARLGEAGATEQAQGPDGRTYHDLTDAPGPVELPGVRLLPEFDALMCGYEPSARVRFATPEHLARLWHQANGLVDAPLLLDGRLTGAWRLAGSGRARRCEVRWFAGTRRPRRAEVEEQLEHLQRAYPVEVTALDVTREQG